MFCVQQNPSSQIELTADCNPKLSLLKAPLLSDRRQHQDQQHGSRPIPKLSNRGTRVNNKTLREFCHSYLNPNKQLNPVKQSAEKRQAGLRTPCLLVDPIIRLSTNFVKIQLMAGPGAAEYVTCSKIISYPYTTGHQRFILYTEVPEMVDPLVVLSALQNSNLLRGRVYRTTLKTTFLIDDCDPGHYEFDFKFGKCSAHLVRYEPQHKGHRGCFAAGYSYFLCGLQVEAASRVVVRAITQDMQVILSRSYSADCERIALEIEGSIGKVGSKAYVTPAEEISSEISERFETLVQEEERKLIKKVMNVVVDSKSERKPLPQRGSNHRHASQGETPLMSNSRFLHKLGVSVIDAKKYFPFEMKLFPCEVCDRALFHEMKHQLKTKDSPNRNQSAFSLKPNTTKYIAQRFRLISRFDSTLNLSETAWFSICPEEIAKHIGRRIAQLARKLGRRVRILDPFCGAGGNIIQAALMHEVERAFACDISASEIACAKRLADLYDVKEKILFRVSDVFDLRPCVFGRIDAVVSSPPWGGPDYLCGLYDLGSMEPHYRSVLEHCAAFTKNMALLLPRNVCLDQLIGSASDAGITEAIELELNFLSGKIKTATVYYGDLVNK